MARLEQLRADGDLTAAHVRLAAGALGVTERTVWRWLSRPAERQPRPSFALSATDREAYAFYRGNVAAIVRARTAVLSGDGTTAGAPVPRFLAQGWAGTRPVAERTLYRAFEAEMTPAERAAWKTGEAGRRRHGVHLKRPEEARGVCWEMDHKQLEVWVLPPRGRPVKPWWTTVVDDGTRALVGWALALTPHTGTVLTAMRMALLHEPERGPWGAVPARVRIDRGLEFAADAIEEVAGALCIHSHRLPGYSPNLKGKVERANMTIGQTLLSTLPGYAGGPRDAAGRLYGPIDDRPAALRKFERAADEAAARGEEPTGPMRIERFAARVATWANWYNTVRPHRMIGNRTPLQAWTEDTGPVRRIDPDVLRHLLLAGEERMIGRDGISFAGLQFLAPELNGRGGQRVHIRYMPHDDRQIEVYLNGKHLCTSYPSGQLTDAQRDAFRDHAAAETRRLGAERRRASRRARRELAPMTGDGAAPAEVRHVPAAAAVRAGGRAADQVLRAKARTNLLGLTPPTADPTAPAGTPDAPDAKES